MNIDWDDLFEDEFDILEIIDFGFPKCIIYDRTDDFSNLDELSFFRRYRLTKPTALKLLEKIENNLEFRSDGNQSISPITQLLTCLRFYASGNFLITVGDLQKMHTSTVSRIIVKVSEAIAQLRDIYITMPGSELEIQQTQADFFSISAFPRLIGAIDGTHIPMESPGGEDAEIFRNRKGKFSINVQVVGNAKLKILDIVANWGGSTHDATIFNNSTLKTKFENGYFPNCFLLADSGYMLRPYCLTLLRNPETPVETLYNESHIRTRNCIERLFGVWKRRFPILACGMRVKLQTRLTIIIATAVLHNIAIEQGEENPPAPEHMNNDNLDICIADAQIEDEELNEGFITSREELINNYFANL